MTETVGIGTGVIDGRSHFASRASVARTAPTHADIHIPEWVVTQYRVQWAKRKPAGVDPMTATAHEVAVNACSMACALRTSVAAPRQGRRRALRWAAEWLQAGCPGVPLPHPRTGWRAAQVRGGGVALYDCNADRGYLWLAPPPWHQKPQPFEEVWYVAAATALRGG